MAAVPLTTEQRSLLRWGARHRRDLPWRATRDRWAVLVSEVMLQQTQVARVLDRYETFLAAHPNPPAMAATPLADVLVAWQGLGYPRRARNLWLAAKRCTEHHGGEVPAGLDELLALPGVGPYTARAVMVFAGEADVGVVDTNIARVLARRAGRPLTARVAQAEADRWVPPGRSWRWNQTLMDLGALVCRPDPRCEVCPLASACAWSLAGRPATDPAATSAHVSRSQARFEGSDRQARGLLLARVAVGPVDVGDAAVAAGLADDPERAGAVVRSLLGDGLLVEVRGRLRLPS